MPFPSPEAQAAGTLAATAARIEKAAAAQKREKDHAAIVAQLETAPLENPEQTRDYLKLLLRAVSVGALDSKAAAAGASVASKLIASFAISISDELKILRARNDECVRLHQHQSVTRRRR
jgi:hypothetical protein